MQWLTPYHASSADGCCAAPSSPKRAAFERLAAQLREGATLMRLKLSVGGSTTEIEDAAVLLLHAAADERDAHPRCCCWVDERLRDDMAAAAAEIHDVVAFARARDRSGGTPAWAAPAHDGRAFPNEAPRVIETLQDDGFVMAGDIVSRKKPMLWPNAVPMGLLTLISGQPKRGKSLIACFMAAVATSGGRWPTGEPCERGSVILMETEDMAADSQARLAAMGGDFSRALVRGKEHGVLDLSGDGLAFLKARADRMPDLRLIVVSPWLAFFGPAGSTDNAAVRRKLEPLLTWAARRGIAVLGILHPPKSAKASLDAQFAGADAHRQEARAAFVVEFDPDDPEPNEKRKRRRLICAGSNVASDDFQLLFRIEGVRLSNGVETTRVKWLGPADAGQAEAAPVRDASAHRFSRSAGAAPRQRANEPTADQWTQGAVDAWLEDLLCDGKAHPVSEITAAAVAEGISTGALYRARKNLSVKPEDAGDGTNRKTWRM